jgi:hypothetical protein
LFNFLNAVADFSNKTWGEIKRCCSFHAHIVNVHVSELDHFNVSLFQFKLPNHGEGRFVGYFDENSIFVVLLYDKNHQVYVRK